MRDISQPMSSKTGFLFSSEYEKHITPPGHPESPRRTGAVIAAIESAGAMDQLTRIATRAATEEEITRCHSPAYFKIVQRDVASGAGDLSTGDTNISPKSLEIALLAAGGVMNAVDEVMTGKLKRAFCAVRPPGHHAAPEKGMGFCLFNNIACGARHAQAKHKAAKVLIADFDVHHGNGTQDIFYRDGSVLFFDTHQSPWYPGTGDADENGSGKGLNCIINCPFPAGSGKFEIVNAFKDKLIAAAEKFKPDLVMLSAGFDSRLGDPLGRFRLTDEDYEELTRIMLQIASHHAEGRFVSVLEGGYNLEGLGKAATAHVKTLLSD
jgi:acetoin utilization deacetylase AcuC-like enzyme